METVIPTMGNYIDLKQSEDAQILNVYPYDDKKIKFSKILT